MFKKGREGIFLRFALTVRRCHRAGERMRRTVSLVFAAIIALSSPLYAQVQADGERPPNDGPPALDDSFPAKTLAAACQPAAGMEENAKAVGDQMCTSYLRGLTQGFYVMGLI